MVSVDNLWQSGKYKLLKTLRYSEILDFIFENISFKNASSFFYFFYNIVTIIILTGFCILFYQSGFNNFFRYLLGGITAGSILVIPVHELIHGITYKLLGAPKINFGADFKQMLFYVAADKFVLNRNGFYLVAISPFFVINIFTIILLLNFSIPLIISGLSFLLLHNIMCIGDFALVSYFKRFRDKDLFTYDDHKEMTSYIFEKI